MRTSFPAETADGDFNGKAQATGPGSAIQAGLADLTSRSNTFVKLRNQQL